MKKESWKNRRVRKSFKTAAHDISSNKDMNMKFWLRVIDNVSSFTVSKLT